MFNSLRLVCYLHFFNWMNIYLPIVFFNFSYFLWRSLISNKIWHKAQVFSANKAYLQSCWLRLGRLLWRCYTSLLCLQLLWHYLRIKYNLRCLWRRFVLNLQFFILRFKIFVSSLYSKVLVRRVLLKLCPKNLRVHALYISKSLCFL